ncbi:hypothetical protein HY345_02500 [Candidatus Microgenomates bacterium]|nr:hypothetical protein [Candidatus Microgenomates bacterium]
MKRILFLLIFILQFSVLPIHAEEYSVEVKDPELMFTNNPSVYPFIPDLSYFTFKDLKGKLLGVLPMNYSTNQTMIPITSITSMPGVAKGTARFDNGGAWLTYVYQDNKGKLHGFYHAEESSRNMIGGQYKYLHASIAEIVFNPNTNRWEKPDYPNNEIITSDDDAVNGNPHFAVINNPDGDGKNYLYAFYGHGMSGEQTAGSWKNYQMTAARSDLSDPKSPGPGSWKKYYCKSNENCGFTQNGRGGKDSKIEGFPGHGHVVWNSYLNRYIALGNSSLRPGNDGKMRVNIMTPDKSDLTHWIRLTDNRPIMNLPPASGKEYLYPGLIDALDGSSEVLGKQFWLYYVERAEFPYGDSRPRKLWRRKITISKAKTTPTQTPTSTPKPSVSLTSSITPSTTNTPKPGDANNDGKVDGVDYVIWLNHYHQNTSNGVRDGDFNKDGTVDGVDYVIWVNNLQ